jgi:tetratricopeptide (TPR) repeat protein
VTMGNSADEIAALVVARLDRREIAKAAEAGLERTTILELARPLRSGEAIDFDQAVVELRNAVGIALDVIAKGERGTNQEAFVEDILKRLAETTKKGDFDSGVKAVDDGLAELDRREEEHRATSRRSRETLLEAGVEQDLLRRDPIAVARRIEAIAALDTTDGDPAWQKYRKRWDAFFVEGQDKGVNLSLEVAIEMARRMVESARNSDQRGTALVLLGNALARLGERERGTEMLTKAVDAYREALKEWTHERVPLEWAATQNNLGNAL